MTHEITLLGATLVLAMFQILLTAHFRTKQYGSKWNMGARDAEMPPLDPIPARFARAQANLFETLPLFIGGLLGAIVAGRTGWKTEWGAMLYFFGRLIYVPLYAAGVPVVRSLVWGVASVGLLLVLWALLAG